MSFLPLADFSQLKRESGPGPSSPLRPPSAVSCLDSSQSRLPTPPPGLPGTESNSSPRVASHEGVTVPSVRAEDESLTDRLRNLQCRIADFLGFDFCMCCGRWYPASLMDSRLDGLHRRCANFVTVDRVATKAGLR